MARIRAIKPDFFRHAGLFAAEKASGLPLRVAFAGLWTTADREGRFKWVPPTLKLDCLPFDDVSFSAVLNALADAGFIAKYEIDGREFGHIPSWDDHQHINAREPQSVIPPPPGARTCTHVQARVEGKGKEGKGKEGEGNHASATRWPPGAVVPDDWIADAEQSRIENGLPAINLRLEAVKFANYWTSADGKNAAKRDWKKTWINWALADDKRNAGRTVSSNHPGGVFGEITDKLREREQRNGDEDSPPHRR